MSWLEPVGNSGTVALRFARFDGRWSEPRTIAQGSDFFINWADFPSIVEDETGTLIAHWLKKSGTGTYAYDIRYAISRDNGRSWSDSRLLNRDGKKVEHGFVSIVSRRRGGFAASWLDGRQMPEDKEAGDMTLRYAEIAPDGRLSRESSLDQRTCECCTTAMASTGSGFVIAYRDRSEREIRDINIVTIANGRSSAPRRVYEDGWKIAGCPVNGPQLDARGRNVAVAWFTGAGDRPRVNVAFSSDGGTKFAAPVRVDAGTPMGRVDILMLSDSDALVIWMEGLGNAAQVSARRVSRSGKLGPIVKLADSSSGRSSGFPRAALLGRAAYFAWTEAAAGKRVHVATADVSSF